MEIDATISKQISRPLLPRDGQVASAPSSTTIGRAATSINRNNQGGYSVPTYRYDPSNDSVPRADAVLLQAETSPIDFGFPSHTEFDRGTIDVRQGDAVNIDLSMMQTELPFGAKFCSAVGILLCGASVVGIPYLLAKLTLVRKGELGLVEWISGNMRVLGPGWHLIETFNTRVSKAALTSDVIHHGALKIIRVLPGHYGLGQVNGHPVVLLPGRHLINDPLFVWSRQESMNTPVISIGTVHLVTVQMGEVGLCKVDAAAHILEPGRHHINNARFSFFGFKQSTEEHIVIGSKHRIMVPAGKVGLGWEGGEPVLLEPGRIYNIDSPTFVYSGSKGLWEPSIVHGSIKIVTVRQGAFGISYDDGVLSVLEPGRHILKKPTHYLAGFLSAGQQVLQISQVTSMTSDNVGIQFDAAVSVKVEDAMKAVTMLCNNGAEVTFNDKRMQETIVQKAKLALSIIIGNNRLNNTFRSTTKALRGGRVPGQFPVEARLDEQPDILEASAPAVPRAKSSVVVADDPIDDSDHGNSFKQHIHDVFMHSFSEHMLHECGIRIVDMSIEDVTITNSELAKAMAQGAVARTSLIKVQIEQEVVRTQALSEQQKTVLLAEGQARAMAITAQAEAQRTQIAAQAEAAKVGIMAEAEAARTAVIAEAEAARIRKLDGVVSAISGMTQQRELVRAAGDVLSQSKSSLVLAHSVADVASLLGGPLRGADTTMSGLLDRKMA